MFQELLDNPKHIEPGPLQTEARSLFPELLKQTNIEPRIAGSPIPRNRLYVVLGIASYSRDDLAFLDHVFSDLSSRQTTGATVSAFDLAGIETIDQLQSFLPIDSREMNLSLTPLVAIWRSGELVESSSGTRDVQESWQHVREHLRKNLRTGAESSFE